MAKGENIFKRKDGRWEARYIKGYEVSGKIKYGFCYGRTYREAKEKVTKCKLPASLFVLLRQMAAYAKVQSEGVYRNQGVVGKQRYYPHHLHRHRQ